VVYWGFALMCLITVLFIDTPELVVIEVLSGSDTRYELEWMMKFMNDYGVYKRGSKAWGMESFNDSGMQQGVSMSRKSKKRKAKYTKCNRKCKNNCTANTTRPNPIRQHHTA
jgi:hypothetical protein